MGFQIGEDKYTNGIEECNTGVRDLYTKETILRKRFACDKTSVPDDVIPYNS
jgi:hypothetical protein